MGYHRRLGAVIRHLQPATGLRRSGHGCRCNLGRLEGFDREHGDTGRGTDRVRRVHDSRRLGTAIMDGLDRRRLRRLRARGPGAPPWAWAPHRGTTGRVSRPARGRSTRCRNVRRSGRPPRRRLCRGYDSRRADGGGPDPAVPDAARSTAPSGDPLGWVAAGRRRYLGGTALLVRGWPQTLAGDHVPPKGGHPCSSRSPPLPQRPDGP